MAKEKVTLIIQDATDRAKVNFSSWEEAHNHIRMVILGQIVDELVELASQDDPSQWKEEIEELKDIAHAINYPGRNRDLQDAVDQWNDYTDHAPHYTTIEIVD